MNDRAMTPCVAFEGSREIASGALIEVASTTKQLIDAGSQNPILIFDDATSLPIEVDFRGTLEDVRDRLRNEADENAQAAETARRPGRPKLGVVAREVRCRVIGIGSTPNPAALPSPCESLSRRRDA